MGFLVEQPPPAQPPAPVTNITVTHNGANLTVSWKASANVSP